MTRLALALLLTFAAIGVVVVMDARPQRATPDFPVGRRHVQDGWYENAEGFRAARKEQRAAWAPMVVYFHTSWCGWCRRLDREFLPTTSVAQALRDTVKVRIDAEAGQTERQIAAAYDVRGYPSLFVLAGPNARPVPVEPVYVDGQARPDAFARALERAGATVLP
jgi:thiol:disulfide interchange protein